MIRTIHEDVTKISIGHESSRKLALYSRHYGQKSPDITGKFPQLKYNENTYPHLFKMMHQGMMRCLMRQHSRMDLVCCHVWWRLECPTVWRL